MNPTRLIHISRILSRHIAVTPKLVQYQHYPLTANTGTLFDEITRRCFSKSVKPATKEEIDELIKNKKLVVFMKGNPDGPKCGFSNAVVQVLRMHGVTSYDAYDVLESDSLRQGIKDYSNWPTIPQIYINGEFVGGCDIMLEMHKNGELIEQLNKVGIESALVQKDKDN